MDILIKAIRQAGGPIKVASRIGRHRQTVHRWYAKGLPYTEFTGETIYSETLEMMQRENLVPAEDIVTAKTLLAAARAA